MKWRRDQLWALAIAIALSLGAGFMGGYLARGAKDALREMVADRTLPSGCEHSDCRKSYERLFDETTSDDSLPPETTPSAVDTLPGFCDEVPMDSHALRGGPEIRISAPCKPPRQN